jgi:hypothetical protein
MEPVLKTYNWNIETAFIINGLRHSDSVEMDKISDDCRIFDYSNKLPILCYNAVAYGSRHMMEILRLIIRYAKNRPQTILLHIEVHGGNHRSVKDCVHLPFWEVNYSKLKGSEIVRMLKRIYKATGGNLILNMSACYGDDVWLSGIQLGSPFFSALIAPVDSVRSDKLNSFNEEFYTAIRDRTSVDDVLKKYSSTVRVVFPEQMVETLIDEAKKHIVLPAEWTDPIFEQRKNMFLSGVANLSPPVKNSSMYTRRKM